MPAITPNRHSFTGAALLFSLMVFLLCPQLWSQGSTVTTLSPSANSAAIGNPITFTARVTSGGQPVTRGLVHFCNAAGARCQGTTLLGQAQLNSGGSASIVLRLGIGSYSVKASFAGSNAIPNAGLGANPPSISTAQNVTVTGTHPSTVQDVVSGTAGNYSVKSTVTGVDTHMLTGTVSLLDTSNGGLSLASATLGPSASIAGFAGLAPNPIGSGSSSMAVGDLNGDGWPDIVVANLNDNTLSILLGKGNGAFSPALTLPTEITPSAVALGDFNADGIPDIVVLNQNSEFGSGEVIILDGKGDGTFTRSPFTAVTGAGPNAIAVGDFNHDGRPDIAFTNEIDGTVFILALGGANLFDPVQSVRVGNFPKAIITDDFNGDGIPDLAVANYYSNTVSILLGTGIGTFTQGVNAPTGVYPTAIASGDFNGDGKRDLAIVNAFSSTITILLGDGTGHFTAQSSSPQTGANPDSIAISDLNGDGIDDLVVTDSGGNDVLLFLGFGNGTFSKAGQIAKVSGSSPTNVAVSDFDGDGRPDVAVSNGGTNSTTLFLNQVLTSSSASFSGIKVPGGGLHMVSGSYSGDTNYAPSVGSPVNMTGTQIATALQMSIEPSTNVGIGETIQLNAVVTPGQVGNLSPSGTISFFNGGTLLGNVSVANGLGLWNLKPAALGTQSISAAYNGDASFLSSKSAASTINVINTLTSTTTLTLSASNAVHGTPITFTASVAAGGKPVTRGAVLFCYFNTIACKGSALFGSAQLTASGTAILKTALPPRSNTVYARFAGTNLIKASNTGPQTVSITGSYPTVTTLGVSGTAGNYTLNATVDAASGNPLYMNTVSFVDTSNQNLLLGSGSSFVSSLLFKETSSVPTNSSSQVIATGDFNGDGNQDAITLGSAFNSIIALIGDGTGKFTQKTTSIVVGPTFAMKAGDFNGDGILDLAIAVYAVDAKSAILPGGPGSVKILLGRGDGTFYEKASLPVGSGPFDLAVADFNGDGSLDLAVPNYFSSTVSVLLGNGDGTFNADPAPISTRSPIGLAAADFNGDGVVDLAIVSSYGSIAILPGVGDGTFKQFPGMYYANQNAQTLIAADFNNDGAVDLAVVTENSLNILLNDGTGSFATSPGIPLSGITTRAVAADLNGDGWMDIVVSNLTNGPGEVFLGHGNGTFSGSSLTQQPAGNAGDLALADFDGDGWPDLAFADGTIGGADVFLTRAETSVSLQEVAVPGSGTHQVQAIYSANSPYAASSSNTVALQGTPPLTVVLVTTSPGPIVAAGEAVQATVEVFPVDNFAPTGTVSLYKQSTLLGTAALANGKTTFSTSFAAQGSYGLTAKFGGNANTAATSSASTAVYVVPATVTSLKASASSLTAGITTTLTATVTSAGNAISRGLVTFCDVAAPACTNSAVVGTASLTAGGSATIIFRPVAGSHSYKALFAGTSAAGPSASAALSITVTGPRSSTTSLTGALASGLYKLTASVLGSNLPAPTGSVSFVDTSNGNAILGTAALAGGTTVLSFKQQTIANPGGGSLAVAVGDFNRDGYPDLAIANVGSAGLTILLGNGDGTFTQKQIIGLSGYLTSIAVGDFNGDGKLDLAIANQTLNTVALYLGVGDGKFTLQSTTLLFNGLPAGLAVGDFNHDGKLDIAVADHGMGGSADFGGGNVCILLGDGAGNFSALNAYAGSAAPNGIAVADLNGDGNLDIVVANTSGPAILLLGIGDGTFTLDPIVVPSSQDTTAVAIADFNKDGKPDLVFTRIDTNDVLILTGKGDGTFAQDSIVPVGSSPSSVAVTDFNLDGNLDLMVTNRGDVTISVLMGNGVGGFTAQTPLSMGANINPTWVAIDDFDGDGKPDAAIAVTGATNIPVFLNALHTTATATATLPGIRLAGTTNHNVTAMYTGNTYYASSTSTPQSLAPNP